MNKKTIEDNKNKVLQLIDEIKREGINDLKEYLINSDFFVAPASTRYHGAEKGMLCQHSLNVVMSFLKFKEDANDKILLNKESCIICGLFHDLCKINKYSGACAPYLYNSVEKGQALLSIKTIEKYIKLTVEEKLAIKYHMGVWGCYEFSRLKGEYSFMEYVEALNINSVFFLHISDMIAARLLE